MSCLAGENILFVVVIVLLCVDEFVLYFLYVRLCIESVWECNHCKRERERERERGTSSVSERKVIVYVCEKVRREFACVSVVIL